MTGRIVNLGRARKGKKRAEKEERAAANRVHYGRTKDDVARERAERRKAARDLAGKKLD